MVRFATGRGASGARFVFSVSGMDDERPSSNSVVVFASQSRDGSREAVWIGLGDCGEFSLARAASIAAGASEMHVHMVSSPAAAGRIIRDLKAAIPVSPLRVNFA